MNKAPFSPRKITSFLSGHDYDLDVCRSFLVVAMVFTHAFEMFYIPDYDRRCTYFVTIGFVLMSGVVMGALYSNRLRTDYKKAIKKLITRGLKLVAVYAICNAFIVAVISNRFAIVSKMDLTTTILSALLGTKQNLFGFDILIPIAFTSCFSWLFVNYFKGIFSFLCLALFGIALIFIETASIVNFYSIKLLIVGLIGCKTGDLLSTLNWQEAIARLEKIFTHWWLLVCIFIYYIYILYFSKPGGPVQIYHHLLPTTFILFSVYLLSQRLHLKRNKMIQLLNSTLAKHMLFSYLFHILLLNLFFLPIPKDSLEFHATLALGFLVLFITIGTCQMIELVTTRSSFFNKIYSFSFKL